MSAQEQNDERNYFECNSTPREGAYLEDPFFLNSEALIDILNENGFDMPRDYLDNLDTYGKYIGTENRINRNGGFGVTIKEIPVKAWIYRENNGTGNVTETEVQQIIDGLNTRMLPTTIQFYLLCDITEINNSNYTNFADANFDTFTSSNRLANAMNIHFVNSGDGSNPSWGGRANFPDEPNSYSCAIRDVGLTNGEKFSILAHEIGHTLGLSHTHHFGRSTNHTDNGGCGDCHQESVSRTKTQEFSCISTFGEKKCDVNGDFLCDTAADPRLITLGPNVNVSNCMYSESFTDNWGDIWTPDATNMMSQSFTNCLSLFSPLQIGRMLYYANDLNPSHPALTINGKDYICDGDIETYSANTLQNVSTYTWSTSSNFTIVSGQGTNTVSVQATNANGGLINLITNCGNKKETKEISGSNEVEMYGSITACPSMEYTYSIPSISGATYYWSVNNATIISGQNTHSVDVIINAHSTNVSSIMVQIGNHCTQVTNNNLQVVHHYPQNGDPPCLDNGGNNDRDNSNLNELAARIYLYPNPANLTTTLHLDNSFLFNLEVFNIYGERTHAYNAIDSSFSIDVSTWENGIYMFKLRTHDTVIIKKLIKNK